MKTANTLSLPEYLYSIFMIVYIRSRSIYVPRCHEFSIPSGFGNCTRVWSKAARWHARHVHVKRGGAMVVAGVATRDVGGGRGIGSGMSERPASESSSAAPAGAGSTSTFRSCGIAGSDTAGARAETGRRARWRGCQPACGLNAPRDVPRGDSANFRKTALIRSASAVSSAAASAVGDGATRAA